MFYMKKKIIFLRVSKRKLSYQKTIILNKILDIFYNEKLPS